MGLSRRRNPAALIFMGGKMEIITMATIAMGIFAKFLESKLETNMGNEEYIELDKIRTEQKYSLKNLETF